MDDRVIGGSARRVIVELFSRSVQSDKDSSQKHTGGTSSTTTNINLKRDLFIRNYIQTRGSVDCGYLRFHPADPVIYIWVASRTARRAFHLLPPIDLYSELPISWCYLLLPLEFREEIFEKMARMQERLEQLALLPATQQRIQDMCSVDYEESPTLKTLFTVLLAESPEGNTLKTRIEIVEAAFYAQMYIQIMADGNATHHRREPQRSLSVLEDVRLRFLSTAYQRMQPLFAARRRVLEKVCPAALPGSLQHQEEERIINMLARIPAQLMPYVKEPTSVVDVQTGNPGWNGERAIESWLSQYKEMINSSPKTEEQVARMRSFLVKVAPRCLTVANGLEQTIARVLTKAHAVLTPAVSSDSSAQQQQTTEPRVKEFYSTPVILGDSLYTTLEYATEFMLRDPELAPYPLLHPALYKIYTRKCIHYELCSLEIEEDQQRQQDSQADPSPPSETPRWWCVFTGQPIHTALDGLYYVCFFDALPPVIMTVSYEYTRAQIMNTREFFLRRVSPAGPEPQNTFSDADACGSSIPFERLYAKYTSEDWNVPVASPPSNAAAAAENQGQRPRPVSSSTASARDTTTASSKHSRELTTAAAAAKKMSDEFDFMEDLLGPAVTSKPVASTVESEPVIAATATATAAVEEEEAGQESVDTPGSPAIIPAEVDVEEEVTWAPDHIETTTRAVSGTQKPDDIESDAEEEVVAPPQVKSTSPAKPAPLTMGNALFRKSSSTASHPAPRPVNSVAPAPLVSQQQQQQQHRQMTLVAPTTGERPPPTHPPMSNQVISRLDAQSLKAIELVVMKCLNKFYNGGEEEARRAGGSYSLSKPDHQRSVDGPPGSDDEDFIESDKEYSLASSASDEPSSSSSYSSDDDRHRRRKKHKRSRSRSRHDKKKKSTDKSKKHGDKHRVKAKSPPSSASPKAKSNLKKRPRAVEDEEEEEENSGVIIADEVEQEVVAPPAAKKSKAVDVYYWTDPERIPTGYACCPQRSIVSGVISHLVANDDMTDEEAERAHTLLTAIGGRMYEAIVKEGDVQREYSALVALRTVLTDLLKQVPTLVSSIEEEGLSHEDAVKSYSNWPVPWYINPEYKEFVGKLRADTRLKINKSLAFDNENVAGSANALPKLAKHMICCIFYPKPDA